MIIAKEKTEKALFSFLRPEFINRVDEIITFRSLAEEDFVEKLKDIADRYSFDISRLLIEITEDSIEKNLEMWYNRLK